MRANLTFLFGFCLPWCIMSEGYWLTTLEMIKPALRVISAEYVNRSESKIINIWPLGKTWKNKGTLFSGTLKVLDDKVYVWLKYPVKKSSVPGLDLSFQTKEPIFFRHNTCFYGRQNPKRKGELAPIWCFILLIMGYNSHHGIT